jgi:chromosome segregation ATPase
VSGPSSLYLLPVYRLVESRVMGRRVLVVGCGDGTGASRLAAAGAGDVFALEADGAAVREISRLHRLANLRFAPWTPPALPVADATVDVLVCAQAPAGIDAAAATRLADEIRRVLAPGGLVVLGVPDAHRAPLMLDPAGPAAGRDSLPALLRARFPHVATMAVAPSHTLHVLAPGKDASAAPAVKPEDPFLHLLAASDQPLDLDERPTVDLPYYLLADEIRALLRGRAHEVDSLRVEAETARLETLRMAGRAARAARLEERVTDLESEVRLLDDARRQAEQLAAISEQRRVEADAIRHQLADAQRAVDDLERRITDAENAMVELAAERDRAERERNTLARAQQELMAEYEALRAREEEHRGAAEGKHDALRALREDADQVRSALARKTGEMQAVNERVSTLQQDTDALREQLLAGRERESSLRVERDRLSSRLRAVEEELASQRTVASRMSQKLEENASVTRRQTGALAAMTETQHSLERERQARVHLEASTGEMRARIEALGADLEGARAEARKWAEEVGALRAERDAMAEEAAAARGETTARQGEIGDLHDRLLATDEMMEVQRAEMDRLRVQIEAEVAVAAQLTTELRERDDAMRQVEVHGMGEHARRRIEELENDLSAARSQLGQLSERSRILAEVAAERDRLRDEATRRGAELVALSERLAETRSALGHRDSALARVQAERDLMRDQIEMRRATEAALTEELERLRAGTFTDSDGRARSDADLAQIRAALEEAQALAQARGAQVAQAQAETARVMREGIGQAEEIGRLKAEQAAAQAEMEAARKALDTALADLARAREDVAGDRDEREAVAADLESARSELVVLRAALQGRQPEPGGSEALELLRNEVERLTRLLVGQRAKLGRELEVRAQEMEEALTQIELRDGEIWSLRDEALRNAARLAAALADIERLRERIGELEQPPDELAEGPPQA